MVWPADQFGFATGFIGDGLFTPDARRGERPRLIVVRAPPGGTLRTSRGCGENSALATSGGDRIEAGRSAMRKGFGVWGSAWRTRSRLLGHIHCGRFWWYGVADCRASNDC